MFDFEQIYTNNNCHIFIYMNFYFLDIGILRPPPPPPPPAEGLECQGPINTCLIQNAIATVIYMFTTLFSQNFIKL